jgi:hypothetical protein
MRLAIANDHYCSATLIRQPLGDSVELVKL